MHTKVALSVSTVLLLTGCAATTPAPRFSAVSPADEDGPEAATPPPAPALAGEPEAQAPAPPGNAPKPAAGHEGHPAAALSPAGQSYSCPMHPEVQQRSPGSCPRCGMRLVKREDAREQP